MHNNDGRIIVHLIGKASGGIATLSRTLMEEQLAEGNRITAFFYEGEDVTPFENMPIQIRFFAMKHYPGANMMFGMDVRRIYNDMKKEFPNHPIVIHAHGVDCIGWLSSIKNIPLVCTIHGISIIGNHGLRGWISEYIEGRIIEKLSKNCGCVIAVSKATADYYQKKCSATIGVIRNGVKKKKCFQSYPKNEKFLVGHVGGVSYGKGWDTAVEGFAEFVKETCSDSKLVCAGQCCIAQSEIDTKLDDLQIADRVDILGMVSDAGNTLMPSLDVLLLPSVSEGLPMTIIEAFAYGVPVVATDVGGICEVLHNGSNGFIIEKDPKAVSKALTELYSDSKLHGMMKLNAYATYQKELTSQKMSDQYKEKYNIVLDIFESREKKC